MTFGGAGETELSSGTGLAPGRRLDRYQLIAPVGRGGMAVVWAARAMGSRGFTKVVAVKTILPALAADPRFEKMFLAEASLCSRLHHANVCEVLDLGESSGQLYLVMEWVHGDTLAGLLAARPGPLPVGVAARIAIDVARGLHVAHVATDASGAPLGIVHRDVSPQNILVGVDGRSKIADFGVAKQDNAPNTSAGYVKGKVRYMAPEQVYCEKVDPRTDIFALGVVIYEATTGVHPFARATDAATLANIAGSDEAAPATSVLSGYSPALQAVVARALSKEAGERFATAVELADALEAAVGDGGRHADVAACLTEACGPRIAARQRTIEDFRSDAHARDAVSSARGPRRLRAVALAGLVAATAAVAVAMAASREAPDAGTDRTRPEREPAPEPGPVASPARSLTTPPTTMAEPALATPATSQSSAAQPAASSGASAQPARVQPIVRKPGMLETRE